MKNPFKFGTVVEDEYFTDRINELEFVTRVLNSENHLILISPRRFGKTSLVVKAVAQTSRPCLLLNLQKVIDPADFAAKLLKELFKLYPWERIKHLMSHFRVIPTISTNPVSNSVDVSFQPTLETFVLLEDAMSMLEKVSTPSHRLIVVLDEFQEIMSIDKGLDKQLRSIMQMQKGINYIILGSQESMMTEIFERKKSPFYHFGTLMRLNKIPYEDFHSYLLQRMRRTLNKEADDVCRQILDITQCHPYYTQQLSSQVWEIANYEGRVNDIVSLAVERLTYIHDLDFERIWIAFNRTDKQILQMLCKGLNPLQNKKLSTSTAFSALKRLMRQGYVIRLESYEVEDPFFQKWITDTQL